MSNLFNPPISAISDDSSDPMPQVTIESFQNNKKVYRRLIKQGLANPTKITSTLQGGIWRAIDNNANAATATATATANGNKRRTNKVHKHKHQHKHQHQHTAVIKVTNRYLHQLQVGIIGSSTYRVNEDILLEQSILKYLTQQTKCPKSIVRFNRFFKTTENYFLVMEDGGTCLFDFVRNAHFLLRNGKVSLKEWQNVTKIMFHQILDCVEFIHTNNVIHFDISLENFLVNDIQIEVSTNLQSQRSKLRFITDNIQVKLCDFGLAELFTKDECLSNKHCGKKQYKSPEVCSAKKQFDAKKNDIWCMGVCMFMIATGCPPWEIADKSDKTFNYVMHHSIDDLLKYWKIISHVNPLLIDLFDQIFKYENERISLYQIKQHIYTLNG